MKFKELFSVNNWKSKAKKRGKENNALRKRVKELTVSRDKSRQKNSELLSRIQHLERSNEELQDELKKN